MDPRTATSESLASALLSSTFFPGPSAFPQTTFVFTRCSLFSHYILVLNHVWPTVWRFVQLWVGPIPGVGLWMDIGSFWRGIFLGGWGLDAFLGSSSKIKAEARQSGLGKAGLPEDIKSRLNADVKFSDIKNTQVWFKSKNEIVDLALTIPLLDTILEHGGQGVLDTHYRDYLNPGGHPFKGLATNSLVFRIDLTPFFEDPSGAEAMITLFAQFAFKFLPAPLIWASKKIKDPGTKIVKLPWGRADHMWVSVGGGSLDVVYRMVFYAPDDATLMYEFMRQLAGRSKVFSAGPKPEVLAKPPTWIRDASSPVPGESYDTWLRMQYTADHFIKAYPGEGVLSAASRQFTCLTLRDYLVYHLVCLLVPLHSLLLVVLRSTILDAFWVILSGPCSSLWGWDPACVSELLTVVKLNPPRGRPPLFGAVWTFCVEGWGAARPTPIFFSFLERSLCRSALKPTCTRGYGSEWPLGSVAWRTAGPSGPRSRKPGPGSSRRLGKRVLPPFLGCFLDLVALRLASAWVRGQTHRCTGGCVGPVSAPETALRHSCRTRSTLLVRASATQEPWS